MEFRIFKIGNSLENNNYHQNNLEQEEDSMSQYDAK